MTVREPELVEALRSTAALSVTPNDLERARERFLDGVEHRQHMRRGAIVAAVLVAVVTVATALVALSGRSDTKGLPAVTPSTTVGDLPTVDPNAYGGEPDALPTVGFIGFPPPGAVPSRPERAAELGGFVVFDGRLPFRGSARLYDDGRFIWYLFHGPRNERSTGYLEQRLTPYGIQILVSQREGTSQDPWNLEKWMPASAWADKTLRPYVPSRYGACAGPFNPDAPIGERIWGTPGTPMSRNELLALFPMAVADLLRGHDAVPPLDDAEDCLSLTTAEARALDQALVVAGFEKDPMQNRYVLTYAKPIPGTSKQLAVRLEPVMPDGSVGCSSCG